MQEYIPYPDKFVFPYIMKYGQYIDDIRDFLIYIPSSNSLAFDYINGWDVVRFAYLTFSTRWTSALLLLFLRQIFVE